MKAILSFLGALTSATPALACQGEAQIIARVKMIQILEPSACFVGVDPKSVVHYQENQTCPLSLDEVIHAGIEVGLRKEDVCSLQPGDVLSGVIFKDVDGTIRLER